MSEPDYEGMCQDCGVPVMNQEIHDRFHSTATGRVLLVGVDSTGLYPGALEKLRESFLASLHRAGLTDITEVILISGLTFVHEMDLREPKS